MNDYHHLDDLLTPTGYDLDTYAAQTGMDDAGGMWTPAYEEKIRAELAYMEAYNARHHGTVANLMRWLNRFDVQIGAFAVVYMAVLSVALLVASQMIG